MDGASAAARAPCAHAIVAASFREVYRRRRREVLLCVFSLAMMRKMLRIGGRPHEYSTAVRVRLQRRKALSPRAIRRDEQQASAQPPAREWGEVRAL